jgi:DNA-binding XRE family transcriptional regulator
MPASLQAAPSFGKGSSGGPLCPLPAVGEGLRWAILEGEREGCATLSAVRGLSVPRCWQISRLSVAEELVVRHRPPLTRPPLQVRPDVWAVLVGREVEPAEAAINAACSNRRARAQLRRLAAAAMRDICGLCWAEVAAALESDARSCKRDATIGRGLLRALRAWPWVALPEGVPAAGWEREEAVLVAWALWRRDVGRSVPPVAGWLDVDLPHVEPRVAVGEVEQSVSVPRRAMADAPQALHSGGPQKSAPATVERPGARTRRFSSMPVQQPSRKRREAVVEARERAHLTQQALADRLGVDRTTVARIEAGTLTPTVTLALAIADALGATAEELFGAGGR